MASKNMVKVHYRQNLQDQNPFLKNVFTSCPDLPARTGGCLVLFDLVVCVCVCVYLIFFMGFVVPFLFVC